MTGPAAQQANQYKKPSPEELQHIREHHISVQISTTDGTAAVSIVGECVDPKCPTRVFKAQYCHRPPC